MKRLLFFLFLAVVTVGFAQNKVPLYKNPSASVNDRVKDLLKRMTLEEKIAQMRHIHSGNYDVNGHFNLNNLSAFVQGKSFGCIEAFPYSAEQYSTTIRSVQQYMNKRTRLGIPVLPIMEALHGAVQDGCTIYPQAIALGSTFNPALIRKMAENIALEIRAIGVKQVLAPDLDLARELRWGRVEETYGEDPYLVSQMGVAYVKGMRAHGIICTPKHYIGHGTPVGGLNLGSVAGGKRELLNLYLQPFEKVIKQGNPLSIMNCYSSYDREPVAASPYLLTELLRNELKFKGYVYSDWGSVSMLKYFHHTAANDSEAAQQAVEAGVDLEAGGTDYEALGQLVKEKKLDIGYIDRAVSHILYAKIASGLFEDPLPDTTAVRSHLHTPLSVKLAKELADESAVLLKNEHAILPLNADHLKSIAVIGPNADVAQFGDYTWGQNNRGGNGVTPLEGIKKLLGDKVTINYAPGCDLSSQDKSKFGEAVEAAKNSEVAVVFVGSQSALLSRATYNAPTCGEGFDLSDLSLTGVQEDLIREVYHTGTPVVVVLVTGKPFAISWEKEHVPAIIAQWYPGEEGGNSIADILFGSVNPSGRLAVSFPQSTGQTPVYYNYLPSDKGYYNQKGSLDKPGRDYVFANPEALYPFGYGLSYTHFEYSDFQLPKKVCSVKDTVSVRVDVQNTGDRDGQEVVQLYVRDLVSSIETPVKQLKAFEKVRLAKGEKKTVTLSVPVSELYLYDRNYQRVVEPGDFELQIGSSSKNIKFKQVFVVERKEKLKGRTSQQKTTGNKKTGVVKEQRSAEGKAQATSSNAIVIRGVIKDAQANLLKGVVISIKGKVGETRTNERGEYTLTVNDGDWLQYYLVGYQREERQVGKEKYIDITLIPEEN